MCYWSAGLLFRSLRNVESAPIGYDPANVLTPTLKLRIAVTTEPSARARLIREAVERAEQSQASILRASPTRFLVWSG